MYEYLDKRAQFEAAVAAAKPVTHPSKKPSAGPNLFTAEGAASIYARRAAEVQS